MFRITRQHANLIDAEDRFASGHLDILTNIQAQTIPSDQDRLAANIELVTTASGANNQSIPRNP